MGKNSMRRHIDFFNILASYILNVLRVNATNTGTLNFTCMFITKEYHKYSEKVVPADISDYFMQLVDSPEDHSRGRSNLSLRARNQPLKFGDIMWLHGIVPLKFDMPKKFEKRIWKALQMISDNTCIHFIERRPSDEDYINIKLGNYDSSYIGRIGGKQDIILSLATQQKILHGFMHVLGFVHQHQSRNRNKYVVVHEDNIKDKYKKDFRILEDLDQSFGAFYEYDSVTHYSRRQGAVDPMQDTITPRDPDVNLDEPYILSPGDVWKIIAMYQCPGYIDLNVECGDS